jgi:hypothetical protein
LFFCGCVLAMTTRDTKPRDGTRYFYYRCALRARPGKDACPQHKNYPAREVEDAVWRVVSELLKDPQTLRVGLEGVGHEHRGLRKDHHSQAKRWLSQIAEARRMCGGYQELAAKGLMTFEELGEKLAQLEADKATTERGLAGLRNLQKIIEGLERDRDALLRSLADMAPEALDGLALGERHRINKMMQLKAVALLDGGVEFNGVIASTDKVGALELASWR